MSDAIEMTYLDISKRRQQQQQQEMSISNTAETDTIPKPITTDESQQHQLTTQSSFTDISDLRIKQKLIEKSQQQLMIQHVKVLNYPLMYQQLQIYKFHSIVVIILLISHAVFYIFIKTSKEYFSILLLKNDLFLVKH
jgi:hypothetical protein